MLAIVTVLLIVGMSMVVTRVATTALTLTGLSRQSARFQARSALTGVGYTTSEAERVVNHPVRRRVVMLLMLVGSAGIVTTIATLMLSFVNSADRGDVLSRVALLLGGVAVLLVLSSSKWVDRRLQRLISVALNRWTDLDTRDYAALLHVHGDHTISELAVERDDWLADRELKELSLPDEGVLILGIQREDGSYLGAPKGDVWIRAGDVLIVYGRTRRLEDLDERRAGWTGDAAHSQAVGEQELERQVQRHADAGPTEAEARS